MTFLNPEHFEVLVGAEVVDAIRTRHDALPKTYAGYTSSEPLVAAQRADAAAGLLGVELIKSHYGCSVRYDSGLQDFGLLRSARLNPNANSFEDALAFARTWVAADPTRRYAWTRK